MTCLDFNFPCRYHRQEGLSWLECYMRMDKAQPTDLNATYLYVS